MLLIAICLNSCDGTSMYNPQAEDHYRQALLYNMSNDYNSALKELNKAIALNDQDVNYFWQRADVYLKLAQNDNAITDYYKITAMSTSNDNIQIDMSSAAYSQIGMILTEQKSYNQAIDSYTKAINLTPSSIKAHEGRGDTYKAMGETSKAIADYKDALNLDGKTTDQGGTLYLSPSHKQWLEQKLKDLGAG